ncbi:hypothetical protein [Campylobacter troglodytis]|nr:hypothetical protein [Campylobacter troglodytis]
MPRICYANSRNDNVVGVALKQPTPKPPPQGRGLNGRSAFLL